MRRFYRVCNTDTEQGLWYDFNGVFTGYIHDKFNFCTCKDLNMDFDSLLIGYLSATPTLKKLFKWFTEIDILRLQEYGYKIHVYETNDYWFYDKFQHFVIGQKSSKLIKTIEL